MRSAAAPAGSSVNAAIADKAILAVFESVAMVLHMFRAPCRVKRVVKLAPVGATHQQSVCVY
jgi:hypothetical protein